MGVYVCLPNYSFPSCKMTHALAGTSREAVQGDYEENQVMREHLCAGAYVVRAVFRAEQVCAFARTHC